MFCVFLLGVRECVAWGGAVFGGEKEWDRDMDSRERRGASTVSKKSDVKTSWRIEMV